MAIHSIKEIHSRILANSGDPDQFGFENEAEPNFADANGSRATALPSAGTANGAAGNVIDLIDRITPAAINLPAGEPLERGVDQTAAADEPVLADDTNSAIESADPISEEPTSEARQERMYFITWEIELGARIYKVAQEKLASVKCLPHADRLKLFDNLENAKMEAKAIFERVAAKRKAKGLPKSMLEPLLEEFQRWDEANVPRYFL